ncbi:MAG TPA: alternative ribosome rescue aminoacyl-tRNA hydrolase ArfB [Gammaproteobacteria bacterium]|jgi:ribosome-associated protein|nr:alternative ribosome rescue aminoacyl-tRNA hydrolase ArfB [Gammaproteobacteria bacterium]
MIKITKHIVLNPTEIKFTFIASPGPGGQNVNKVATAVQLRFNVVQSLSLPEDVRDRLIASLGKRLTGQGELIIKASNYRTQERNKQDALSRLSQLIKRVAIPPKKRKKTKPTYASKQRRLETKKLQGQKKALRHYKSE